MSPALGNTTLAFFFSSPAQANHLFASTANIEQRALPSTSTEAALFHCSPSHCPASKVIPSQTMEGRGGVGLEPAMAVPDILTLRCLSQRRPSGGSACRYSV